MEIQAMGSISTFYQENDFGSKSVDFDVSVDAFDNATKSVTAAVGKTMSHSNKGNQAST